MSYLLPAASAAAPRLPVQPVSRKGAGFEGSIANWRPRRVTAALAARERTTVAIRAEDLAANEPHAGAAVDSIATSVVGPGLYPQSRISAVRLGMSPDDAAAFQAAAEDEWRLWCAQADAGRRMHFGDMQFLALRTMLIHGEFLHLPIISDDPHRDFDLAVQALSPVRLATPNPWLLSGSESARVHDGVLLGANGRPEGYFIRQTSGDPGEAGEAFAFVPARIGHRPGVLHRFHVQHDEQVRGVSILAPAMKFFRDLGDFVDYELVAANVAAAFPLFIETHDPAGVMNAMTRGETHQSESGGEYNEYEAGQILYGRYGEKVTVLKNERPGPNFDQFVTRILRSVAASCGVPYEVIGKDFSKTNYSSARAAMLEAWRVFRRYRTWLERQYCQPLWEMVLEESWLRGRLTIPKGCPDFYAARALYTAASWIGPPRGHVDPVKEVQSDRLAMEGHMRSLSEVAADSGEDWETRLVQIARERRAMAELGLPLPGAAPAPVPDPEDDEEDEDEDREQDLEGNAE